MVFNVQEFLQRIKESEIQHYIKPLKALEIYNLTPEDFEKMKEVCNLYYQGIEGAKDMRANIIANEGAYGIVHRSDVLSEKV